ncbi:TPA: hypothetical protein ACNE3F_003825 [Escherichia coli]
MKYLAVFLAVLTAGPACGAELIKFVPEELTMKVIYEPTGGGAATTEQRVFTGAEPKDLWLNIKDRSLADRKITITPKVGTGRIEPTFQKWYYDTINGNTGVKAFINENYAPAAYMPTTFGASLKPLPLYGNDLNHNTLPTPDDPYQQRIRGSCGVPVNIRADGTYPYLVTGVNLSFTHDYYGATASPNVIVSCMWKLRPIYDISLKLERETMTINDKSGSNRIYDNKILVTGNGGPATITIVNPSSHDVSVSYSDTDDNVLAHTTRPTSEGAAVPFYVLVKNTSPGTRSYNVTFNAEYN